MKRLIFIVNIIFVCLMLSSCSKKLNSVQISKMTDSAVIVNVYDSYGNQLGNGSGFFVNDDTTVVTNYHVIEDTSEARILTDDGKEYIVTFIMNFDKDKDVAILKVSDHTGKKSFSVGDSDALVVGDKVFAIGCPMGLQNTVSDGIVSAFREEEGSSVIQITAPISPGSSGGVLLNESGEAVGITFQSMVAGQNLNFAIPSNVFSEYLKEDKNISYEEFAIETWHGIGLGNTLECYSEDYCSFVEYNNKVYHSFMERDGIAEYDFATGNNVELGINGYNLSAYKNVLYYIDEDNGSLCRFDLVTHSQMEPLYKEERVWKAFVTNNGIVVVTDNYILLVDENGKIIKKRKNDVWTVTVLLLNNETLVTFDYEADIMKFMALESLEVIDSINVNNDIKDVVITNDEEIWIGIGTEEENIIRELICYTYNEGVVTTVPLYSLETNELFVNDKIIYEQNDTAPCTRYLDLDTLQEGEIKSEYIFKRVYSTSTDEYFVDAGKPGKFADWFSSFYLIMDKNFNIKLEFYNNWDAIHDMINGTFLDN